MDELAYQTSLTQTPSPPSSIQEFLVMVPNALLESIMISSLGTDVLLYNNARNIDDRSVQ